ncbi:hypothetical protein AA313_de0202899 [Arthrobotrys entomopaga]|nr:hypothetical protein AA313_de0202899 [Arthrobotrys entomopaga]
MKAATALAALLELSACPTVLAYDPINWDNLIFEWVTVTVTDSACAAPTALSSTLSSTAPSPVPSNSVTTISYDSPAQILGQPVVEEIITSLPRPTVQTSWASTATYASFSSSTPAATATLRPAVVSNANLADPENLRPKIEHNLYYAGDSNAGSNDAGTMPIANVKFNFTMDAVNLESSHIQSVTCSANPSNSKTTRMNIIFSDKSAYDTAVNTWPANEDFLLIGFFPGCAGYAQSQRSFSKVHGFTLNSATMEITATVEDLAITDAISEGEIKFGSFSSAYASGSEPSNSSAPYYGVGVPDDCLGDKVNNFDIALDNALGVLADISSFASRFKTKRAMRRRREAARFSRFVKSDTEGYLGKRWSIGGFLSDIGDSIASAVTSVVDTVKDAAEAAWDSISGAMKTVGQAIAAAGKAIINNEADFDYIDTTAKWSTFLSKDTKYPKSEKVGSPWNTPWGEPGFLLAADYLTETKIFCVDCGIQGNIKLNGHLTFSLKDGLKAASFTMNGTMHSNVQFGIFAEAVWETKTSVMLFDIPLGPIEIPGVFDIGPQIIVSAEASASIRTAGMITAGFSMDWSPYISLDMMDWTSQTKGWEPVLHPMVQVDGEIVASVGVSLPIQIGFGVNLFKGWILKTIVIGEKPGLSLSARVAGRAHANEDEQTAVIDGGLDRPKNFTCPDSVALFLDFTNSIDLEVLDVFKKNLGKARVPLWQECIGGSNSSSSTSTATETTSSTTETPSTTEIPSTTETSSTAEAMVDQTPEGEATPTAGYSETQSPTDTTSGDNDISPPTPIVEKREDVATPLATLSFNTTTARLNATYTFTTSSITTSTEVTDYSSTSSSASSEDVRSSSSTSSENISSTSIPASETTTGETTILTTLSVFNISSIATASASITSTSLTPMATSTISISNSTIASTITANNVTTTTTTTSAAPTTIVSPLSLPKIFIKDAADGLFVNTNTDGTIYLCDKHCGSPAEFYTHSNIAVADTSARLLHGYSKELETYGVSRFRLHPVDKLPNTAMVVGLYEFQKGKIVAVSKERPEEFLLPVVCRIEGQPSKVFLVKEFERGVDVLKELGGEIAGGKVVECSMKNFEMVEA